MRWSDFFYMHRSDRQIVVLALVVGTIVTGLIFVTGNSVEPQAYTEEEAEDSTAEASQQHSQIYYQVEQRRVERFPFDPNTADSTQLLRLGLQPWQVRNIYKYRAAGGIYRRKEDFAKLYGLTVKEYRELESYIYISADYLPASTLVEQKKSHQDTVYVSPKMAEGETLELSTADTAALRRVPGIGSYFARRIVQYRERLGGFVNVDQLDEIDDFPQEAKSYFALQEPHVKKLNVNRLPLNELKRHPYINYYQARAITDYRRQKGKIQSLNDLRLLDDFPQEAIDRLIPYVEY